MDEFTLECWLPVPGWEDLYLVSDQGRVRTQHKRSRAKNGFLKLRPKSDGYFHVALCRDGRRVDIGVHQLVLLAFAGPRPAGKEARHLNGNPADNRWPENLVWGTKSENTYDRVRHGTHKDSRKTCCRHGHKFTPANTYMHAGKRHCKTCRRDEKRRRRAAARSTQLAA